MVKENLETGEIFTEYFSHSACGILLTWKRAITFIEQRTSLASESLCLSESVGRLNNGGN